MIDLKNIFARSLRNPVLRTIGIAAIALPGGAHYYGEGKDPMQVEAVQETPQTKVYKKDLFELKKRARPIRALEKRIDSLGYRAEENKAALKKAKTELNKIKPEFLALSQKLNTQLLLDPEINEVEYKQFAEVYERFEVDTNSSFVPRTSVANSIQEVRVLYQDNIAATDWTKAEMMVEAAQTRDLSAALIWPGSIAGGILMWLGLGAFGSTQTMRRWSERTPQQKHFH